MHVNNTVVDKTIDGPQQKQTRETPRLVNVYCNVARLFVKKPEKRGWKTCVMYLLACSVCGWISASQSKTLLFSPTSRLVYINVNQKITCDFPKRLPSPQLTNMSRQSKRPSVNTGAPCSALACALQSSFVFAPLKLSLAFFSHTKKEEREPSKDGAQKVRENNA